MTNTKLEFPWARVSWYGAHNAGTHFGSFERLFGRNARFSFSEEALDKVGYVPPRDRNVFDTAADNVAVGHRDTVSDSIATVDDHSGHHSLPLLAVPARG